MSTYFASSNRPGRKRIFCLKLGAILLIALLSGCSGGGVDVQPLPDTSSGNDQVQNYTGPPPASDDVQRFKINVWDNLVADNRCGQCHIETPPGQSPMFVRGDDINLAYAEANTIVELKSPSLSRMVAKVASGHHCWLSSNQACADIIQGYITDWAGGALGGAGASIALVAPPLKDPGASKNFPGSASGFAATIYPLLTAHCAGCHTDTSATPQAPYFANADVNVAYQAAQSKINLDNPADSRLVVRLGFEFHNCWTDCASNSNTMLAAATAYANGISATQIDPALLTSKALTLSDGILANTGGRHEANVIAKWEFKAGQGTTAFDTSGVNPAIDLTLSGDISWVGGWGIQIKDGKAQASTATSKKLYNLIAATGEYSIEAWIAPSNVTQEGPARIISYSGGTTARNFTVGQTLYNYDFLNRSSNTDGNGEPALSTTDADEIAQAALQHVVLNYNPTDGRSIYVNGQKISNLSDPNPGGNLTNWDSSFAFVLGNEVSSDRQWRGAIRMVAIHNRELSAQEIQDNYKVGVGEKFLMLFNVSDHVAVADAYVVMELSQYDNYSYLFNKPYFISLDGSAQPNNIDLQNMRIGINGREAAVGQAYRNINVVVNSTQYNARTGQTLSSLGTIIALEKGPQADEFFLTFEKIGNDVHRVIEPPPAPPSPATDLAPVADIGIRTFEEINATLAKLTTVSMNEPGVVATYLAVKQALPTTDDIQTFVSAQQMAVTQLSIEYCNALVENIALRSSYFPGVDFTAPVTSALATGQRDKILNPLLTRMLNWDNVAVPAVSTASQPDVGAVKAELNALIDRLTSCGSNCAADRTKTVVKATCAAALGNAAMLLQ